MDDTNAGTPSSGTQVAGDASRQAAISRLKKLSETSEVKHAAAGGPPGTIGPPESK